jgi:hypothetical protein
VILVVKSNSVNPLADVYCSKVNWKLNGNLQIKKNDTDLFVKKITGLCAKNEHDTQATYGSPTFDNHYADVYICFP